MRKFLCFLLFLALTVMPLDLKIVNPRVPEPSSQPMGTIWDDADPDTPLSPDMPMTRANVLRLLDKMDPDGAFIIRSTEDEHDFMTYIVASETIGEGYRTIETAVHEECHTYTSIPSGLRYDKIQGDYTFSCEWVYIGNGRHIEVPLTDVFASSEMVDSVPEHLRTYRFNAYLTGNPTLASIQHGVYGMLNEFTAYCWGIHNSIMLESLEKNVPGHITYIGDFTAYAEFRFYILYYMLYAKEHYPDVYAGIMDNSAFREAFTTIDRLFAGFAEARKNDYYMDDWNVLMNEMQKPEYVNMALQLAP